MAACRARSKAPSKRSRSCTKCSSSRRASSVRLAKSVNTRSRYARTSAIISRPCCLATSSSCSASPETSDRRRDASTFDSSSSRAASRVASRTTCSADSAARVRIAWAASRATLKTRAASAPNNSVTAASSIAPTSIGPRACIAFSSLSKNRSRSKSRAISTETCRRKSRTSSSRYPRRLSVNWAAATAAGDDGSGRWKSRAMPSTVRPY